MPLFQACTNCGSQIHVRKLTCPCGHVFRGSKPLTVRSASRKSDVSTTRASETEEQTAKRRKCDRERVKQTRASETEEQTAKRRRLNKHREAQRRSNVSVEAAIDLFVAKTKQGPDFVCCSCHRMMYRANVVPLNKCKYV